MQDNERIAPRHTGGRGFALTCLGVFELRDGKIVAWRDYFDMASFQRGMAWI
jgi:limonene-1,2-epoxide hydrolase